MIKMVASDLDGTLLIGGRQTLPEEIFPAVVPQPGKVNRRMKIKASSARSFCRRITVTPSQGKIKKQNQRGRPVIFSFKEGFEP